MTPFLTVNNAKKKPTSTSKQGRQQQNNESSKQSPTSAPTEDDGDFIDVSGSKLIAKGDIGVSKELQAKVVAKVTKRTKPVSKATKNKSVSSKCTVTAMKCSLVTGQRTCNKAYSRSKKGFLKTATAAKKGRSILYTHEVCMGCLCSSKCRHNHDIYSQGCPDNRGSCRCTILVRRMVYQVSRVMCEICVVCKQNMHPTVEPHLQYHFRDKTQSW